MLSAVGGQFCHYFMSRNRPHRLALRDIDICQVSLVIRAYKAKVFTLLVKPYYARHAMGQDFYHPSLFSFSLRRTQDDIFYFIPLESSVHVIF